MKTFFLAKKISYTGAELSPHWISAHTQEFSSALVAFCGPCQVATAELVDLEDARANSSIVAKEMLHFLGEDFQASLAEAVVRQRLLVALFLEELRERLPAELAKKFYRDGDDIYYRDAGGERKLTVSIATATAVSTLLHFGVNIDASGAPVAAVGLNEFSQIQVDELARAVLQRWQKECDSMHQARCKVLPR
jgi:hypothetical protein